MLFQDISQDINSGNSKYFSVEKKSSEIDVKQELARSTKREAKNDLDKLLNLDQVLAIIIIKLFNHHD